jgi:hypothetical protein
MAQGLCRLVQADSDRGTSLSINLCGTPQREYTRSLFGAAGGGI